MAGTREGGLKAKAANMAKNPNFYSDIGRKGGKASNTGGFAANPALARIAGAKGGRKSKRGKSLATQSITMEQEQQAKEILNAQPVSN